MQTQRVDPAKLIPKNAKVHLTVKNIVFDSKNAIFVIYNNIFAEYDHRLKNQKSCRRSKTSFNQRVLYCRMPGVIAYDTVTRFCF